MQILQTLDHFSLLQNVQKLKFPIRAGTRNAAAPAQDSGDLLLMILQKKVKNPLQIAKIPLKKLPTNAYSRCRQNEAPPQGGYTFQ